MWEEKKEEHVHLKDSPFRQTICVADSRKKKEVEEKTTLFQKVHAKYTLLRLALPLFEKRASFSSFE